MWNWESMNISANQKAECSYHGYMCVSINIDLGTECFILTVILKLKKVAKDFGIVCVCFLKVDW